MAKSISVETKMKTPLVATLKTKTEPVLGQPIWVRLTITNDSDQKIELTSPEVGVPNPDLNWNGSNEAYQVAVLMSFGLLQISLVDPNGGNVSSRGLMPWVTPLLGKRLLRPHDNLAVDFDIYELFSIDSPGVYKLRARYGDEATGAEASSDIEIKQPFHGGMRH